MDIRYDPDLPPPPEGGRAAFEWQANAHGPMWAATDVGGWTFRICLAWVGGEFVVGELRVHPLGQEDDATGSHTDDLIPPRGLTATRVRNFRFGELISQAIHGLTGPKTNTIDDQLDWHDLLRSGGFDTELVAGTTRKQRRGRPPLDEVELASVAYLYDKALGDGVRAPINTVAEALGDPNPDRVRQVVSKCRERGFLTEAPAKGVPGGHLTERAIEVLERIGREINEKTEESK